MESSPYSLHFPPPSSSLSSGLTKSAFTHRAIPLDLVFVVYKLLFSTEQVGF